MQPIAGYPLILEIHPMTCITTTARSKSNRLPSDEVHRACHNGELFRSIWLRQRRGLVGFWDMLAPYGYEAYAVISNLYNVWDKADRTTFDSSHSRGSVFVRTRLAEWQYTGEIRSALEESMTLCVNLEMTVAIQQIERINAMLATDEPVFLRHITEHLQILYVRLIDECKIRYFFLVPNDRRNYYDQPSLFGDRVNDRFPSAANDINKAGTALALGLSTAAVFHCMRVLELGLASIAKYLRVRQQNNWGKYIEKIQKIMNKPQPKSAAAKRRRNARDEFFGHTVIALIAVKNAWRNTTMHIERTYDPDEAEAIFKATCALMQEIAKKCREP